MLPSTNTLRTDTGTCTEQGSGYGTARRSRCCQMTGTCAFRWRVPSVVAQDVPRRLRKCTQQGPCVGPCIVLPAEPQVLQDRPNAPDLLAVVPQLALLPPAGAGPQCCNCGSCQGSGTTGLFESDNMACNASCYAVKPYAVHYIFPDWCGRDQ